MASPVRKAARIVSGLLVLAVAVVTALYAIGTGRVDRTWALDYDPAGIPSDSASLVLGAYLADTHGCTGCHAADLSGQVVVDAPPFRLSAPNLTSGEGGVGRNYTDADWLRAIRHGVRPDGSGLYMMPSSAYWYFSDREIGALIAHLKSAPAIDHLVPRSEIRFPGRLISAVDASFGPDLLLMKPDRRRIPQPEEGPTAGAEWGRYRASVLCTHCHGVDLHGGPHPDPSGPPAPDLVSVRGWTVDGFIAAMRTGTTPGGRAMDPAYMPWEHVGKLTDAELEALWAFFQTL